MEDWKKDLKELRKLDTNLNKRDLQVEKSLNKKLPLENDEDKNIDLNDIEVVENDK